MRQAEHATDCPPAPMTSACMVPVALDVAGLPIGVAGSGLAAQRRVAALLAAGARHLQHFEKERPSATELAALRVLWIVGLEDSAAAGLAAEARAAGVLVNVEDRRALCDFHNVAELRRGDLLIGVSTGGASPRLAGRIRGWLEGAFGPEWAGRVAAIAAARQGWLRETDDLAELSRRTDVMLRAQGWSL